MHAPTFREAVRFWTWLGFVSFGGPSGQIAIMHRELVERRGWISEARFLHALNYCMSLPGPEAQQLAVYVGWLLHRTWGGVVAGTLFLLPGVVVLLALSAAYVAWGTAPVAAGALLGLKAVVLAVVAHAALRLGRRALRTTAHAALAAAGFVALLLGAPFPLVVLGAALVGFAGHRVAPRLFAPAVAAEAARAAVLADDAPPPAHARPDRRRLARVLAVGAALWIAPLVALLAARGAAPVLVDGALFFTKAALLTFGGAYAVLPYVADVATAAGWLDPAQMADGLGLAETTPGPLILVVTFVGFLAGWNVAGALDPWAAALLGGLVATWFTFLPGFVLVLAGGPWVERLRGHAPLGAALGAVTAAVVGVILHLAVFFARHVIVGPAGVEPFAVVLAVAAFVALLHPRVGVVAVILAGAAVGALWTYAPKG